MSRESVAWPTSKPLRTRLCWRESWLSTGPSSSRSRIALCRAVFDMNKNASQCISIHAPGGWCQAGKCPVNKFNDRSSSLRICPIAPERRHLFLQNVGGPLAAFGGRNRRSVFAHRIFTHRVFDQMVQGCQLADRIGRTRIARQQKGLAAAPAEIFFAAVARAAGLGHPLLATKFLKCFGTLPDPIERVFAHVVEAHARNHACRMTRQCAAGGVDQQQLASPAAHAGLGEAGMIIGNDRVDADLAAKALLGL